MSRLPFLFIITGIFGFVMYHAFSLLSLTGWLGDELRGPEGWFHAHLFVLGWATMLAMGAIYQLIHVILQSNIYSLFLGYCHYFLFSIGIVGMLYGFIHADVIWIAVLLHSRSLAFCCSDGIWLLPSSGLHNGIR